MKEIPNNTWLYCLPQKIAGENYQENENEKREKMKKIAKKDLQNIFAVLTGNLLLVKHVEKGKDRYVDSLRETLQHIEEELKLPEVMKKKNENNQ